MQAPRETSLQISLFHTGQNCPQIGQTAARPFPSLHQSVIDPAQSRSARKLTAKVALAFQFQSDRCPDTGTTQKCQSVLYR